MLVEERIASTSCSLLLVVSCHNSPLARKVSNAGIIAKIEVHRTRAKFR
jgi:hypothetical protein